MHFIASDILISRDFFIFAIGGAWYYLLVQCNTIQIDPWLKNLYLVNSESFVYYFWRSESLRVVDNTGTV
jgi:hypothetical protein